MSETQIQESITQQQRDLDETCVREHDAILYGMVNGVLTYACEDCRS